MVKDVFNAIDKLKKILAESQNSRLFTIIPEKFSESELNVAKSDRDKMIEILNQFYKEHYENSEGVDDFITLFGVYVNYYVLCGLHLILKEGDFGTTEIFENIADDSLKEYLSLMRLGICEQNTAHFEKAAEKNEYYSLAHFYLFLSCLRKYWSQSDLEPEKELLRHYKAIRNEEFRKYAVGLSDFVTRDNITIYAFKTNFQPFAIIMAHHFGEPTEEVEKVIVPPPLPVPVPLTTELKQNVTLFSLVTGLYFRLIYLNMGFSNILNDEFLKDFSDTLAFISQEMKNSSNQDKFAGELFRFFKESKINIYVAALVINIFLQLPVLCKEMGNNLENILHGHILKSSFDNFERIVEKHDRKLEEIYLNDTEPIVSNIYNEMENLDEVPKIDSIYMAKRQSFLQILYEIKWTSRDLHNLMQSVEVQSEKDTMVRDFMHIYGNMEATDLYDMAQAFLKRDNPEDKTTGRKLLLEYGLKKEISDSVYTMQLMYKNRIEDLKNAMVKSLVGDKDDGESVMDVFNKALRQCLINIFYGVKGKDKIEKMRKNLKKVWGEKFFESDKRDSFERRFMDQDFNCVAWLSQEGIIFVCEQEAVWEKIFLTRDGFASNFLKIIFDELCVNVFKYGDLKKEIRLYLSENESKDLVITFVNNFLRARISGTQIGLNLMKRRIQILHENPQKKCVEAVDDRKEKVFQVKLTLPSNLFLNKNYEIY